MIKINLLPHATRKKAAVSRQMQLVGLGGVLAVGVLLSRWWSMVSDARELRFRIDQPRQELARYEEVAGGCPCRKRSLIHIRTSVEGPIPCSLARRSNSSRSAGSS